MTPKRPLKRSTCVTLVGVGVAVSACVVDDSTNVAHRDVYRDRAACVADWSEDRCASSSSGPEVIWMGPWYYGAPYTGYYHVGRVDPPRIGSRAVGSVGLSRPGAPTTGISGSAAAVSAMAARSASAPGAGSATSIARGGFGSSAGAHSSSSGG